MIKILLIGYDGAMGSTIVNSLPHDFEITSGVSKAKETRSFKTHRKLSDVDCYYDAIVDFSHASFLDEVLDYALEKKKPLLIASTGLSSEQHEKIDRYSQEIPIVQSGNYSLGVYAMQEAVKLLANILDDFDLEIIEKHHKYKKDAPSGTAEMLFESLKTSRPNLYPVYGRKGQSETKSLNEVGIHSIRQGSVVGEHSVIFAGEDEILEIKHEAFSKKIFAMGAFKAVRYIITKDKGRYTLKDVVEHA